MESHVLPTYRRREITFQKGEGARLWDTEGKEYIDFVTGIGVTNIGHSHPEWVKAVTAQLGVLTHVSNLYEQPLQEQLGKELSRLTRIQGQVFFCNSGTESNEAALKLAMLYGKESRPLIASLEQSFHGRTLGSLSLTGQEEMRRCFIEKDTNRIYIRHGDIAHLEAVFAKHGNKMAAVCFEPILIEGGVYVLSKEFVQRMRQLCDEYQVLLIADEVQTGVGRTGQFLGCHDSGVLPDAVCLAKGLGAGLPIGALLVSNKHAHLFSAGVHGSTFGGGPVVMQGALAVCKIVEQCLLSSVAVQESLQFRCMALADKYSDIVEQVRGRGFVWGLALKKVVAPYVEFCHNNGLMVLVAKGNVLRMLPPLTVDEQTLDQGFSILEEALKTL